MNSLYLFIFFSRSDLLPLLCLDAITYLDYMASSPMLWIRLDARLRFRYCGYVFVSMLWIPPRCYPHVAFSPLSMVWLRLYSPLSVWFHSFVSITWLRLDSMISPWSYGSNLIFFFASSWCYSFVLLLWLRLDAMESPEYYFRLDAIASSSRYCFVSDSMSLPECYGFVLRLWLLLDAMAFASAL